MRAHFTDVNGVRTRYFTSGEGPAVLLLHGLGISADFWFRNFDSLARTFRVVAPDLLGHGFTDAIELGDRLPQEVALAHLKDFVATLGLDRFALVGSSYGAYLASLFSLDSHDSLTHLVLIGDALTVNSDEQVVATVQQSYLNASKAMGDPTVESCRARLRAIHYSADTVPEEVLLSQITSYARPEVSDFYLGTVRALANTDRWTAYRVGGRLGEIRLPILRVEGRDDPRVDQSRIEATAALSPDCRVVMFEQCGHQPYLEHADRFNSVVTDFLTAASRKP
jgi:2-hydroxy-6-oxonona-2,4-dienedioate hydrolase